MPEPHAALLRRALERLAADPRLVGVAIGGSYLTGAMDEFSDVDLVVAVEPAAYAAVSRERQAIAQSIGPLLAAFTGEHVGEPRLLICLYGPPPVHVDLKFVSLDSAATRVEDPAVLWERDGRFSAALGGSAARFPEPDLQWIEDRFWIWIHYSAAKIGRGELFEAVDSLSYLRSQVLGPLALLSRGQRPTGVRKLEFWASDLARTIEATVPAYDAPSCARALRAAVDVYRRLREALGSAVRCNQPAEDAAMEYLRQIEARCGGAST